MFTGIIEGQGRVLALEAGAQGARLALDAGPLAEGARPGDSMAVNGVCLTAVRVEAECLHFDVVPETLHRTNLGTLRPGDVVNLERPLRADGRFAGHLVQGHVDGVTAILASVPEGEGRRLRCHLPAELARYVVEKGSIALDGVSLTVARRAPDAFEVALVPHTLAVTTLGRKAAGDPLNVEVDILAKYVEQLLGG